MTTVKRVSISPVISSEEVTRPNSEEAREAVRTLIRWAGDNPNREGLIETPDRVVRAFGEWYSGYDEDPISILSKTFEETNGYDEMIVLRNMRFSSFCEHHMAPIIGKAHVIHCSGKPNHEVSQIATLVSS